MNIPAPIQRFIIATLAAGLTAVAAVGSNTTEATEPLTFVLVVAAAFAVGALQYARHNWPKVLAAASAGGGQLAAVTAVGGGLLVLTLMYGGATDKAGIAEPGDKTTVNVVPFAPGDSSFNLESYCNSAAWVAVELVPGLETAAVKRVAGNSDFDYVEWKDDGINTSATRFFVYSNNPTPPAGKKAGDADRALTQVLTQGAVGCMRTNKGARR